MSLIEMVLAVVIIGVGLAGVVLAFSTAVRASSDPLVQKQMLAIAEEMMEEIVLKPYATAANTAPSSCGRSTYNDIQDYNGYTSIITNGAVTTKGICDIDGNRLPTLASYDVTVSVAAENLPKTTGGSVYTEAQRITVTVTHGLLDRLQLVGWRTNYAGP